MDLIAIRESRAIKDVVWTYDLGATINDEETWQKFEKIITDLLDEIISIKDTVKENQVKNLFKQAVEELERLLKTSPLDDFGIYEYGGLNDFFAEILESLNFQTGRNEQSEDDYIIDFVYKDGTKHLNLREFEGSSLESLGAEQKPNPLSVIS